MISMFKENCGKLMVYASTGIPRGKRLESVRTAAKETAKRLNLDFDEVRSKKTGMPIYVYFEDGNDEAIPLYCDEGKIAGLNEISSTLRNMMYVLSFHPKHAALKHLRNRIITPS